MNSSRHRSIARLGASCLLLQRYTRQTTHSSAWMKLFFTTFALLLFMGTNLATAEPINLRIGIFAYRDKVQTQSQWQPLAGYMERTLGQKVILKVYDMKELDSAISQNTIDVVLTTPGHFIQLLHRNGLSAALATQITGSETQPLSSYGATIFTRSDATGLTSLNQISGTRFASAMPNNFIHQVALFEMLEAGIALPDKELIVETGLPSDRVVDAVLSGRADAGVVRSGVLEAMVGEGKLDRGRIRVLNQQQLPAYPHQVSTRLYPEWPVAVLPHIDEQLARQLTVAFLTLPPGIVAGVNGFTVPANYDTIEDLMRKLRVPPFDAVPEFTLFDFMQKYTIASAVFAFLIISLVGATILMIAQNRKIRWGHEALRQSEETFRTIVESSPLAMYFYHLEPDGNLILTGANPAADSLIGIPHNELIGKRLEDAFPKLKETDIPEMYRAVARGTLGSQTFEIPYDDGQVHGIYDVHVYKTAPETIVVSFRDIRARKQAEEDRLKMEQQLFHTQKLESLGVLAGGIAHDFNNILMAIIGNADLALMRLKQEPAAIENLKNIEKAAFRAADLAKQMLAYSGKGKFVIEQVNLNHLLEEMVNLLEVSISKKAALKFNYADSLPLIEADTTQMRQIVMNLVSNASEAIGDANGTITITTGFMACDSNYLKNNWLDNDLPPGEYVFLEIADTGCGITKETATRLFDPFFTTKFTGRGLGMSAVLGIVRGHGGTIKVYSEPGQGATFKVLLPAIKQRTSLAEKSDWPKAPEIRQNIGTVLLVDDEESVRTIGTEMLKELGFEVITATDGREALEIFRNADGISFVILDLTMPHLDGEQCFHELRHLQPDVQVIMSSGYNELDVTQRFIGKGLAGFIQKPYRVSELQEVIAQLYLPSMAHR